MALIQCPECKTDISDKAASCPKCGNPMIVSKASENSDKPDGNLPRKYANVGFILGIILWWGGCAQFRIDFEFNDLPTLIFYALLSGAAFSAFGYLMGVASSKNVKSFKK